MVNRYPDVSAPHRITGATPRGTAVLNSIELMQTAHTAACTSCALRVCDCGTMKTNRQHTKHVMALPASALLGLRKHSLQAADKSTIVDSSAAHPEIGMTYFIMSLTSHGRKLFLLIPAKIQFLHMLFRRSIWKARIQLIR